MSGCPPGATAQFLFAFDEVHPPFDDGFRCVGGGLLGRFAPLVVGPQGDAAQAVDFSATPIALSIGSVPKFQCWYRDPAGAGGTGFNASSALSVSVCP